MKVAFPLAFCNLKVKWAHKGNDMTNEEDVQSAKNDPIIREIIELERSYFFEKRNVKTERQRKLRDLIERHTKPGDVANDT